MRIFHDDVRVEDRFLKMSFSFTLLMNFSIEFISPPRAEIDIFSSSVSGAMAKIVLDIDHRTKA